MIHKKIIRTLSEVNKRQRKRIVEKLQETLKVVRGHTIGILGLSFKPHTDDLRDSPALNVIAMLLERGAMIKVYDPVAMENCRKTHPRLEIEYAASAMELAAGCDALALITDWPEFAYLDWGKVGQQMRQKIVIDGRNMLPREKLDKEGFLYMGIGV